MIAIGCVAQRSLLINDGEGGHLGADADTFNVVLCHDVISLHGIHDLQGRLASGDRVAFNGIELEAHTLHDPRSVRSLEHEIFAPEERLVEAPLLCGNTVGAPGCPLLVKNVIITARIQAPPAAQPFRSPVLGAWR